MTKDELLRNILEDLNEKYPPGLYEFLCEHHGSLFKELQGIESETDHPFSIAHYPHPLVHIQSLSLLIL